jgi:hypothetical protein
LIIFIIACITPYRNARRRGGVGDLEASLAALPSPCHL